MVVSNIKKYLDDDYMKIVNNTINEFINENQENFFESRKKYLNKFSKNASKDIAKIIYNDNKR